MSSDAVDGNKRALYTASSSSSPPSSHPPKPPCADDCDHSCYDYPRDDEYEVLEPDERGPGIDETLRTCLTKDVPNEIHPQSKPTKRPRTVIENSSPTPVPPEKRFRYPRTLEDERVTDYSKRYPCISLWERPRKYVTVTTRYSKVHPVENKFFPYPLNFEFSIDLGHPHRADFLSTDAVALNDSWSEALERSWKRLHRFMDFHILKFRKNGERVPSKKLKFVSLLDTSPMECPSFISEIPD